MENQHLAALRHSSTTVSAPLILMDIDAAKPSAVMRETEKEGGSPSAPRLKSPIKKIFIFPLYRISLESVNYILHIDVP